MAVTPVLAGSALAWSEGATPRWLVLLVTLACAVLIQVGTNLQNDAADFERGNDRPGRTGPLRITAAGWASPGEVRRMTWTAFALAAVLGLLLVWSGGLVILGMGLFSIAAAWAYSGGTRPVSYTALGELFVLVFFGLVAVSGSQYLQSGHWSTLALPMGLAIGSMAAAVLLLNNYRDLSGDAAAGRRTLAVLIGPRRARVLYALLLLAPFALPLWLGAARPQRPAAFLTLLALPVVVHLIVAVRREQGAALNPVLCRTGLAQLAFGALLALGLLL